MTTELYSPYEDPIAHQAVSDIIRERSSNRMDVRVAVLSDLDLSFASSILDLGCGFGFMTEEVVRRAAPGASVTGVDICMHNEAPFLRRLRSRGEGVKFQCSRIYDKLSELDQSFDLIISSYSLYFFPQILAEVSRVLQPKGLFLALTHSDQNCVNLLSSVGAVEDDSLLASLIENFSAENGLELMQPYFEDVKRRTYPNTLQFGPEDLEDFVRYLEFKLPLFLSGEESRDQAKAILRRKAKTYLERSGGAKIRKDDAVFICRRPKCP